MYACLCRGMSCHVTSCHVCMNLLYVCTFVSMYVFIVIYTYIHTLHYITLHTLHTYITYIHYIHTLHTYITYIHYIHTYTHTHIHTYIHIYIISYISRLYMEVLNFATQLHPESSQLRYIFGVPTRLEPLQLNHPPDTHCGTSRLVVLQDGLTELAEAIASTVGMRVGHATCGCVRSPGIACFDVLMCASNL